MKINPSPFLLYLLATIVMTWPLAAGLTRDVPSDLGDPLLNMWILGWGAEHFPRVDWHANIFHPEPYALAFSEHLFGQVLQILPVYYLTGNVILCYNLLFLSTFVLSGLGMYLLVRDLTNDRRAAFVAGLIFAFVPFRVAHFSQIQILSSQWMPLAMYGFRRAIEGSAPPRHSSRDDSPRATAGEASGSVRLAPLAGGTAALLMQNWSCGYYLVYFAPFIALFVVHQIAARGRLRDRKLWIAFGAAAVVTFAGTWPFLSRYLEAQRVHVMVRPRPEIISFSTDVYGYLTAPEPLRVLGGVLRAWPRAEGEVFLGFVPAMLAALAIAVALRHTKQETSAEFFKVVGRKLRPLSVRRVAIAALVTTALAFAAGLIGVLFTGGFVTSVAGIPLRATNAPRLLWQLAGVLTAIAIVSPHLRRAAGRFLAHPAGLAILCLILAAWLSLGPLARTRGHVIPGFGLYALLLDYIPGFDGLRSPGRYAMIAALYLAILAGIGAAWLMQRARRASLVAVALCAAFLAEAAFAPMHVNGTPVLPARVEPPARAPRVYRHLATIPGDVVLAEFPFGDTVWDVRYVYYSTVHWKRLVNGYSGYFPQGYRVRVARLQRVGESPNDAWQTLVDAGTTHVIVHERAFPSDQARGVESWLRTHGAREAGRFEGDVLYDLSNAR